MEEKKGVVKCPNCGSTEVQFVANTEGGGYSCLKGCLGFAVCPIGALCGLNKTETKNVRKCLACGKEF